jgi:diguanylate cyclase (GGDEF)-like protein
MIGASLDDRLRPMSDDTGSYEGPLDALTGLLDHARIATVRAGAALALVDLRHFRERVNDPYGHLVGDDVIRTVAHRLMAELAPRRVFRYGGDEFLIELEGAFDKESAADLARRIGNLLAQPIYPIPDRIEAWIGITLRRVSDDVMHVVLEADQAVNTARKEGVPYAVFGEGAWFYLQSGPDGRVLDDLVASPGIRLSYLGDRPGFYVTERPEGLRYRWPVRVFRVTDIDVDEANLPRITRVSGVIDKCRALTVDDEIPGWRVFGVNGETVARLIEQVRSIDEASVGRFSPPTVQMIAKMDKALAWVHTQEGLHANIGGDSAAAVVRHTFFATALRSPKWVVRMKDTRAFDIYNWMSEPVLEPVLVDPRWEVARVAASNAAWGFAAQPFIDDKRFQLLISVWVAAMGDPSVDVIADSMRPTEIA